MSGTYDHPPSLLQVSGSIGKKFWKLLSGYVRTHYEYWEDCLLSVASKISPFWFIVGVTDTVIIIFLISLYLSQLPD